MLLLIGLITRYAAVVSAVLLVVFLVGILQAAARGMEIQCGCFGGGGGASTSTSYTLDILRDLGLLVLSAFLIRWPLTKFSADEWIIASEMVPELTPQAAQEREERAAVPGRGGRGRGRAAAQAALHRRRDGGGGGADHADRDRGAVRPGQDLADGRRRPTRRLRAGVTVGNQQAPVPVDVYEDFQCPICNDLEQSGLTKDFDAKIKATNIKVNYHVMSFLDSSSNGNKYSSRAANAGYCASDQSPDAFLKFHDIVYGQDEREEQPAGRGEQGQAGLDS